MCGGGGGGGGGGGAPVRFPCSASPSLYPRPSLRSASPVIFSRLILALLLLLLLFRLGVPPVPEGREGGAEDGVEAGRDGAGGRRLGGEVGEGQHRPQLLGFLYLL
jgi:hypothetical protein